MIEELIKSLPEVIKCKGRKAFLEVTWSHVYYCTKHDNKGNLNCVFVSIGKSLEENLLEAKKWIEEGIKTGEIENYD